MSALFEQATTRTTGKRQDTQEAPMQIERRFTRAGAPSWSSRPPARKSAIPTAPSSSGSTNVEVPARWSQVASDVIAQKYFRKAGVPARAQEGEGKGRARVPVALGGG
jgi:ribonucleoside-diphosphate reductase alpha chain